MKKYLLLVVYALMVSFTASADYEGECGDAEWGSKIHWTLASGTLGLDGNGWCIDIRNPGESPWYDYRLDVKRVNIGWNIYWLEGILFAGCDNLTAWDVDPDNEWYKAQDGFLLHWAYTPIEHCFNQVTAYLPGDTGQIVMPEGVWDIQDQAFVGCKMSSIVFNHFVKFFGHEAFRDCKNLTDFYIYYENAPIGGDLLDDPFKETAEHLTLHVPASLVDKYKEKYQKYPTIKIVPNEGQVGDVNGDGKVDVSDITALNNLILAGDTKTDINGDGVVDVSDITALINMILE